jgi:hypothetical protein
MTSKKKKTIKFFIIERKKSKFLVALVAAFALVGVGTYFYLNNSSAAKCSTMADGNGKVLCYASYYASISTAEWDDVVKRWNVDAGCGSQVAWCSSFLTSMVRFGRSAGKGSLTCSTSNMVSWYKSYHHTYSYSSSTLQVGDIVYRTRPNGGHVGIVESITTSNGYFTTIEGNSQSCRGGRDCVVRHRYNKSGVTTEGGDYPAWQTILRW